MFCDDMTNEIVVGVLDLVFEQGQMQVYHSL